MGHYFRINNNIMQWDKRTKVQLDREIRQEIDISNYVLADGVRMKNADLSGFEVEYTGKQQSVPDFKIEVPISRLKLKADIDYDISEMTPEQLEVFEALNYEGDEADYEELEDDFVLIANDGIVPLKSKQPKVEMAEDLAEAIKKEEASKKKFTGDLIKGENAKKDDRKQKIYS